MVYSISHTEGREGHLPELIDLVDKETVWENDPLFSRDAVSQYTSKPDKYDRAHRRKKLQTYMAETKEGSEPVKCPACAKNHDLEGCQVYLNKSLEDRSKFIYTSKLCYGCLSSIIKDLNAKNCKNRRSCKKCNEKQLTTLHRLKIGKKTTSRDKTNNENNISTNSTLVQESDEKVRCCPVILHTPHQTL